MCVLYVVYGEKVPDGYQLYDSFEQALEKHPKLPAPGLSVRKFPDTVSVDAIVEMTNGSTMEEKVDHLRHALSAFQKAHKLDAPQPKQTFYVVYGPYVVGGYQLYDSFEVAHAMHKKLPMPGKLIRKFVADVTFDKIVDATKGSTKEGDRYHLYEELATFREYHGIATPANDCQRYRITAPASNVPRPASEYPEPAHPEGEVQEDNDKHDNTEATQPFSSGISMESVMLCLPQVITCYIDGSCLENHYGGFAAILLDGGRPLAFLSEAAFVESSLEAEWRAAHLAFRALDTDHHQIYLYSDCNSVVNVLSGSVMTGRPAPAIQQLYYETVQLAASHDVIISHIKGHAGVTWNEFADALAKKKADAFRTASLLHDTQLQQQTQQKDALSPVVPPQTSPQTQKPRHPRHPVVDAMQQTLAFTFEDEGG